MFLALSALKIVQRIPFHAGCHGNQKKKLKNLLVTKLRYLA
jgi:hypothetical protein